MRPVAVSPATSCGWLGVGVPSVTLSVLMSVILVTGRLSY